MTVDIFRPGPGEQRFHAKVTGSGNVGVICTQGRAERAFEDQHGVRVLQVASSVIGKNYQNLGEIPANPAQPTSDPNAKFATLVNAKWCIHPLPNVTVGSDPGAANVLQIWAIYADGTVEPKTHQYNAISGEVECDSESGMACPPVLLSPPSPTGPGAHGTAPLTWKVVATGFLGPASRFNGPWALTLSQTIGGQMVWSNGGNGDTVPLIELRGESPVAVVWRLHFRLRGAPSPVFQKQASHWNPLKSNVLDLVFDASHDLRTLPSTITLTPG